MTRAVLFLLFTPLMALAQPAAAQPKDPTFLIEKQVGQATGHTCQSYVLAIAFAFKRDRNLPLRSWRDVRELEQRLRAEVVKARMRGNRMSRPTSDWQSVRLSESRRDRDKRRLYGLVQGLR